MAAAAAATGSPKDALASLPAPKYPDRLEEFDISYFPASYLDSRRQKAQWDGLGYYDVFYGHVYQEKTPNNGGGPLFVVMPNRRNTEEWAKRYLPTSTFGYGYDCNTNNCPRLNLLDPRRVDRILELASGYKQDQEAAIRAQELRREARSETVEGAMASRSEGHEGTDTFLECAKVAATAEDCARLSYRLLQRECEMNNMFVRFRDRSEELLPRPPQPEKVNEEES